jgi:UDP-GlcNAc:undecaprenyl-phosphate GlcNAc-1-phosphate transferase
LTQLVVQVGPAMVLALGVSAVLLKSLRRPAKLLGLVDTPGGRKAHDRPTPTIGGVAILIAFSFALVALLPKAASTLHPAFWTGLSLLAVAGLVDDARGLKSWPKLAIQVLAAGLAVFWGGVQLQDLGSWPSGASIALGAIALPLTWLAIVGFVNAANMLDGVDGLAGGVLVVMLLWLAYAGSLAGAVLATQVALVLAAALVGFLIHNMRSPFRRRASVFLGDAGSLSLGFAVAWLVIVISQAPDRAVSPVGLAWVVVLPVMDTVSLMARRLIRGQNPFHADRNHLHHILGRAGFSPGQSAALLGLLTIGLGAIGVLGSLIGVPDVVLGGLLALVVIGHYLFVRYAWRSTRAIRRLRAQRRPLTPSEQLGLIGLYVAAVGLPFGSLSLLATGYGTVLTATLLNFRTVLRGLLRTRITWAIGALVIWLTFAIALGPQPGLQHWWTMVAISGLLALPLGWWFARLGFFAAPLFSVLLVGTLLALSGSVQWPMLEAGFLRVSDYWGRPTADGLLLALVLMPLLVSTAVGVSLFRQRWRARAFFGVSLSLIIVALLLLLGTESRSALMAALLGLVVIVVAAAAHGVGNRLWTAIAAGALTVIFSTSLLANLFAPAGVSLNESYLEPVRSAVLYAAGEPELARSSHPAVAERLDAWAAAWRLVGQRPLAGFGVVTPDAAAAVIGGDRVIDDPTVIDPASSAYSMLGLAGGGVALLLFVALLVGLIRALARAGAKRYWPLRHAMAAYGALGVLVAFLFVSPLVTTAVGVMLFNAVIAVGVAAAVANPTDPDPPAQTP